MSSISRLEYEQMRDRTERARHTPEQAVKDEVAELHEPIRDWCRRNNAPYQYTRPDKKTGAVVGSPDFFIVWKSSILVIECKSENGELSPAQSAWHRQALDQGVLVHVIYSMQQFYDLVRI